MLRNVRILLVEDSPDDVHLIERELEKSGLLFRLVVVKKKNEFETALDEFQPDVILCDHFLPSFNSIEALLLVKEWERKKNICIPLILVTGTVSEDFSIQSIKAGAHDFILKDRLKRLPSSIQNALEKSRSESEKMKYFAKIVESEGLMKQAEQLAHFGSWEGDLLTGKYKWSDETYRIFGYLPGEVEPNYAMFLEHVHRDDMFYFENVRKEVIARLDAYEYEFRIIDKGGNIKHLASKVVVKRDENHNPVRLIGVNLDITVRKNAEALVIKSEQEYRSLFDQNPDPVYSLDLHGHFTKVNKSLIELSRSKESDLLQLNFRPFIAPEDSTRVEHHFKLATEGQARRYQTRMVDHEGNDHILDVTNIPIVVNDEIIGVHGIAKDITDKIRVEQLLEKVYRLARIGGWEVNVRTGKLNWTAITKELHEVPADFIPTLETGIGFYKVGIHRDTITQVVNRAVAAGEPYDVELQIVTAKGNERWIRAIGEAEFREGECIRLYGSFQDIHERKQAEEALKEAYAEKAMILESIGDAFFAVDRAWTVTYWNKMAETILQMPRSAIIGKNLWEVYSDAIGLEFYRQYHMAVSENRSVQFQEYYPRLNMWIDVSAYPSETGLSVYFRDVTELRNYIGAIERRNVKLREIADIVSHEVRGSLARVMGLIQLVTTYPDQSTDLPYVLKHIATNAHELDTIIRKIVRRTEELEGDSEGVGSG